MPVDIIRRKRHGLMFSVGLRLLVSTTKADQTNTNTSIKTTRRFGRKHDNSGQALDVDSNTEGYRYVEKLKLFSFLEFSLK